MGCEGGKTADTLCFASIMRPAVQERIKKLMERGFHKPGDVEERLGYYVGQVGR